MLVAAVLDRVATVPSLEGRVEGAADLAEMMRNNRLPQVTPAAHVLPMGLTGGAVDVVTGLFRQHVEEAVAVVLTWRSFQGSGAGALGGLDALIDAVIHALAGWTPQGATGPLRLARGRLVSMAQGTIVYELQFLLPGQLRIPT